MKTNHINILAVVLLAAGLATSAFGQLQWNAYDTSGNLVTANVASGGDATYGGSATFTVPAGTQLSFVTKTFVPFSLATANSTKTVSFQVSASGGLSATTARAMGWGLYNSTGTASFSDDVGYFGLWNAGGPYVETYDHPSGTANLFSGTKLGQGGTYTGSPVDNTTYTNRIQLIMNSSATGISLGNSGSSLAAAGLVMTGPGVTQYAYCNPVTPLLGGVSTFDEFGFMFYNGTAASVTVTLSGITLVPANPVISSQPVGYSGSPGDNTPGTSFDVTLNATSVTPLSYQWYQATATATNAVANGLTASGSTISGATSTNLAFVNAQVADSANYFVVITNTYGSVTSSPTYLNISASASAPVITGISPTNATIIAGNGTNVTVIALGSPSPVYYWYDNNTNLLQSGSSSVLTLANVQPSGEGTYSVMASNLLGTASTNFTVTVIVTPGISGQPTNLLLNVGSPASFTVTASGVPAPTYQWYKGVSPITAATNSTYSIASVAVTDLGVYKVVVSNAAGSVTSSNAILAVYSAINGTPLAPANHAAGVGYDTPLSLSFNEPPAIGTTGKVRIYNINNTTTPVDTLDLGQNAANGTQARVIGGDTFNSYPVIVGGNTAVIYPHPGVLTSNQTYYVTIDPGVILDTNGAYFAGITATNVWQFTTKVAGPANPTNLVVAADGSGDFETVQGAVDSVPANNTVTTFINIRDGTYTGIVDVKSKNNLKFRGQSRGGTLIEYANNNNVNPTGAPLRAMFVLSGNDCAFENLTLTNTTPNGGSQAEAVDVEGTRCIFYNMELDSYQDTFLVHSAGKLVYFQDSLIQGNTDFNWGYGTVFYTNCELRCLTSGSLVTQPRSPLGSNGFSFVNCKITKGGAGVTGAVLGRSIATPTTPAEVIFVTCLMDDVITGYNPDAGTNFWSFSNSNLTATVSKTLTYSTELAATNPIVALASSATNWLYGWQPQMAPNILTNPMGQAVMDGSNVTFTVAATGIPAPTYQWLKNGTNISGATSATLTISNAAPTDAGSYSVVVTSSAGSATSGAAVLTVSPPNTPPVFTAPANGAIYTINVGVNLAVSCTALDTDTPPQTLVYSLLAGPTNAAIDAGNGHFTWRPTVTQANSVNPVEVVATDNGAPNLSATNSFTVAVNPLTQPAASSLSFSGGQFSLSVNGETGPDYAVQVSTNLAGGSWTTIFRTNSPVMPFSFTNAGNGAVTPQFFRLVTGPPLP